MDMFISMLEVGLEGYKLLLKNRKSNFDILKTEISKWADSVGESVILNYRNRISLAVTLRKIGVKSAQELGAWLYRKGVMGARVVVQSEKEKETEKEETQKNPKKEIKWTNTKKINNLIFRNFGGHTNDEKYKGFPYMTLAAAIGSEEKEIHDLVKRLNNVYQKMMKKQVN
jgi:O-phospho-L-seryl-tRNASec:L-selenocysteinyl-tRNA synthase